MRILTSLTLSLFFVASTGINAWANAAEDVDSEATVLLVSGQYEDAIKRFTIAISLDPKLATAYEAVSYTHLPSRSSSDKVASRIAASASTLPGENSGSR